MTQNDAVFDGVLNDLNLDFVQSSEDLNIVCERNIRDEVADHWQVLDDWQRVGRDLGVSEKKLVSIKNDLRSPRSEDKAREMLDAFSGEFGSRATCLKLARVLFKLNLRGALESLCKAVDRQKSELYIKKEPPIPQSGPSSSVSSTPPKGARKSNGSQQKGKNESEAPTTSGIDLAKLPSNIVRPARPHWRNIKVVQRSQHPDGTYHLLFKFDHKNEQNIEVSVTKSAERLTFKIVKCDHLEINSESEYCCHFEVANEAHEAVFEDIVRGEQLSETQLRFLLDNVVSVVTNKIHYASHPPQYGIFLSHKSKDKPIINAVKEGLQFIGYKTWIDQENIGAGEVSTIAMKNGIDQCDSFLAWMNEEFFGSDYCKGELKYALQKDKIIFTFGNHHKVSEFFTGEFDQLRDRNIVDPSEKSLFEILHLIDDALHK